LAGADAVAGVLRGAGMPWLSSVGTLWFLSGAVPWAKFTVAAAARRQGR